MGKLKIKRALISVYDKTDVVKLARSLKRLGVEIISTGGTAKALQKAKVKVIDLADITGYPSILGGRVKSLHPVVHGGILAVRDIKKQIKETDKYEIPLIDLVITNLYPFQETVANPKVKHKDAIEKIDVGGPTMVRAAAKNHQYVAVVVDPKDYDLILKEMRAKKGALTDETREALAAKAFRHTADYEAAIAGYFERLSEIKKPVPKKESAKKEVKELVEFELPEASQIILKKVSDLRYGENPHQKAAFYHVGEKPQGLANVKQLSGKELSFNNLLDLDAAQRIVKSFDNPCVTIIKHSNPCGVAMGKTISLAYEKAYAGDPLSAFGSIVGANRKVDAKMAKSMSDLFVEALIAPGYEGEALRILSSKKNLRIMMMPKNPPDQSDYRFIEGGMLLQERDQGEVSWKNIKVATRKSPSSIQIPDLVFVWKVAKFVKSNAIVIGRNQQTLGVGAGQMSRVDAVEIALKKAGDAAHGAVLASDAFFPFPDAIHLAARAGVAAIIQPGGSIRDDQVIDAANGHGIAMVFTGMRHFRH